MDIGKRTLGSPMSISQCYIRTVLFVKVFTKHFGQVPMLGINLLWGSKSPSSESLSYSRLIKILEILLCNSKTLYLK